MSYIEELKELGKLRDDGILTDDEFNKKKDEILSKDSQSEPNPSDTQTVSSQSETSEEKSQTMQDNEPEEKLGLVGGFFNKMMKKGLEDRTKKVLDIIADDPIIKQSQKDFEDATERLKVLDKEKEEMFARFKQEKIEENKLLYDDKLLKFLKKNKGELFSMPKLQSSIGKATDYGNQLSDSAHKTWLRDYLEDKVKSGIILHEKKGNAFYYYIDKESRLKREEGKKKKIENKKQIKQDRKESLIKKYGKNDGGKVFSGKVFMGMTSSMLKDSKGKPDKVTKNVYKSKVKENWYYGERTSQQKTSVYALEIRLEDGVVVGYKDLE